MVSKNKLQDGFGVGNAQHPNMLGELATKYKLIFVGDTAVGKSAIIQRYFNQAFDSEHAPASTIACDYKMRNIKLKWDEDKKKKNEPSISL